TYERQRDAFDVNDPAKKWGPGGGLYRTTDGGKTFTKLTRGLPTCSLGRIGLCYSRKNPRTVFAVIESEKIGMGPPGTRPGSGRMNRNRPYGTFLGGQEANVQDRQGPEGFEYGGVFKSADGGGSWVRVNSLNPRPMYFSQIRVDPADDRRVYVL